MEHRDSVRLRALIQAGESVAVPQVDGMTALHWAAYFDDIESARCLVQAGADAKATNRYGVTPLFLGCQNGDGPMVECLLAAGADPEAAVRGGETALMTAARTGCAGPVEALLARGCPVDAKEEHGQTALMWAAAEGHAAVVELLLSAGADLHATLSESGFTPWFFAARNGRTAVIQALLKRGADVNEPIEPRRSPAKGPRKGMSALMMALENGHFDLAVTLLEAGADPNDQRSGFTPLHAMTWVRKPNRGEDDGAPPPRITGSLGTLEFVRKLVEHGSDVNARLKKGRSGPGLYSRKGATPFLMAAATADLAYMRLLVSMGADPRLANVDGCTPLMVACGVGVGAAAANETAGTEPEVLEAARFLLNHGVDVNAVDENGETAMHGAAYKNLPKVVQFLADHGERIDAWNRTNRYGWTPLMIAEGHRPGNFKPSAETITALRRVMEGTEAQIIAEPH